MINDFVRVLSKSIYAWCAWAFVKDSPLNKSNQSIHDLIYVNISSTCTQLIKKNSREFPQIEELPLNPIVKVK